MPSQITCPVQDDDCNSISSLSICYVPCCSFSLSSLQSANDSEVPINRFKPADIIANMQTRAAVKKQHDDGDSVNWDTESIFDPPQRNSKSHELDSKLGAKPTGIPSSSNPLFTPLGVDDTEKAEADTLSFKQSLSNDLEDDSFSDYLGMNQHSLKGSPMARSPMAHDLQLNIPFPSPLHDMNDKDAQIMNEALGMSFDFNENPAAMGLSSSPPSGRMGFNFPRLKPSSSSFSLSTPPRNSSSSMDRTREHKDASSAAAFPVDARNQLSSASNYGTPTHRFSQGRAIYHVAGKSPSKYEPTSHSTPERSYEDNKGNSEKSPEFSPPRSKLRTESRTHDGPKSGSSNSHSHHRNDILPVKNCSTDFCVTPSPSHSQSRISKAVSDESNTPPAMNHYPPSTTHPMSYHGSLSGTPASASFPNSGEAGLPHPPSYTSPNWSNSLHLAPLPPFVSSNGAPPSTPQWHHVNGAPPQANAPAAPYGYPNYSPYYPQQTTPPRYPTIQSTSKESSAEATHWRHKHHLLYQFRAKFGHCRVPPGYGVGTEYEGLFEWVMDQHYQHQRMMNGEVTTMTPTRARVLSDIGVVFAQVPNDHHPKVVTSGPMERKAPSSWSNWMSQLAEYRKRHGDCDVPLKYPANPCLGTFVNRQRTEYRKMLAKKPSSMTNEKIEELNKLGFTWDVRESHTSWEERFEELKAYKRENGHANVPKVYSKNPSLGYWVNEQRFQYRRLQKKKSSYMTEDKIKALNSLDFKWSLRETNGSWNNWLAELKAYKDQHGDVDVPLKYKPNLALGAFVNRQRTEYRKLKQGLQTSLNDKRINDLNSLGFKWSIRVSRTPWEQRLDELKKFKAEHGHTNVPSTYPPNQPLAYWIFKQRGQYRIYTKNFTCGMNDESTVCHMTPERIRMLDEIGFEWNPPRRMK